MLKKELASKHSGGHSEMIPLCKLKCAISALSKGKKKINLVIMTLSTLICSLEHQVENKWN